ncbi:thiamine-phosphate kinase [Pelagibacteraceae bacterium]|nr:thiamine-phosphate kinase [Pelagibacteraceae bacterium]
MKKKLSDQLSEEVIINSLLKKLNFNKKGTFNFENDAAYLSLAKNYKTIVTTDSITENIDFFYNDPPESVAQKLVCVNLSDLSAMGSTPVAYTLNLSLNARININWLKRFTNRLFKLQKKYNFYLLGGDISKSSELTFSANFFGKAKLKDILSQNKCSLGNDIWITGNLGNSYLGYRILMKSKIKVSNKDAEFYKNSYLYPTPCMFGLIACKFISAATDISDGFYGDLNKILNNKVGAIINKKNFLISKNLRNIISINKLKISIEDVLSWGDDYQLVFTANKKFRNQINNLGKINNVKLMNIGRIIKDKGIYDDSMNIIKNPSSYDHFS